MNTQITNRIKRLPAAAGVLAVGACALAASAAPAMAGDLRWSGDVDDTAVILVHGDDVRIRTNKNGVRDDHFDFRGAMPRDDVRVRLNDVHGRGDIDIVQTPNARNGYTAAIRIKDPKGGRGHYAFTLHWDDRDFGRRPSGPGWNDRGPGWRR